MRAYESRPKVVDITRCETRKPAPIFRDEDGQAAERPAPDAMLGDALTQIDNAKFTGKADRQVVRETLAHFEFTIGMATEQAAEIARYGAALTIDPDLVRARRSPAVHSTGDERQVV